MKKSILTVFLIFSTQSLIAADDGWSGEGELGAIATNGNTKATSITAKLDLANKMGPWKHELGLGANNVTSDSTRTSENYFLKWKSARDFTPTYYGFGSFRYDDDSFSGFDFQSSLAAGIGMHTIKQKDITLDLEAGIGYQVNKEKLTGDKIQSAVFIGGLFYKNQFTTTTRFTQDITIEAGSKNSYIESETALRVSISDKLGLKVSLTAKHNTDVAVGTKKTDTISAVTLSYDF